MMSLKMHSQKQFSLGYPTNPHSVFKTAVNVYLFHCWVLSVSVDVLTVWGHLWAPELHFHPARPKKSESLQTDFEMSSHSCKSRNSLL